MKVTANSPLASDRPANGPGALDRLVARLGEVPDGIVELAADDGGEADASESVDTGAFEFGELDLSTDDEGDLEKDDLS